MLRVGVIGLGRMGKLHFLNALRMKDVKVIAVAEKSKANQKLARKYNVKAYDDFKELVSSEDLDVVINSLPNFLKKDSILYAAENGLDIFVDKPLARDLAEAEEIVGKIGKENVRLVVGVNYRCFDSVQKLKQTLDEGRVGDAVIATSELIMDGPFSHSLVPRPVPEWWFDRKKAGGGALLDLGYHLIDILNWIFGDLEIEFSTLGYRFGLEIEDSVTAVLRSRRTGVRCVVNAGWFSKTIFPDFNFRISLHGTVGQVSTDQFAPRSLYRHALKEGVLNLLRRVTGKNVRYLSYTYYYSSFFEVLDRFFNTIRRNVDLPERALEEQLEVIKTIDDIYKQNGVS